MVWEFPAVSQSRIEFWKEPQYSKSNVLILTVIFGIFGLHHLYLRSPQTALFFLIGNFFTLGYWYFYDILQLMKPLSELNTYGLSTPFGPTGIAKGMFLDEEKPPQESSLPHPIFFVLYVLTLPFLPLSHYIAGDTNNSILSIVNFTNPIGIVLNLFTIASEYLTVLFKPAELFTKGITRIFPFPYLGFAESGYSKRLTGKENPPEGCEDSGFFQRLLKAVLGSALAIFGRFLPPEVVAAIESALLIKRQVVNTAVKVAQTGIQTATQIGTLAATVPTAAAGSLAKAASMASSLPMQQLDQMQQIQQIQKGGGLESASWSDYAIGGVALALLGGGFLLQTGRSLTDAYRINFGKNDSPPIP